jgi:hypothetical protein
MTSTGTDNIFANSIRFIPSSKSPIINGPSDHYAHYLMINNISAAGNFKAETKKSK